MIFSNLFSRANPKDKATNALYDSIVQKARDPAFYTVYGVPDTVDGRYDLIVIHAMLVFRHLRKDKKESADIAQSLFDLMFTDMDRSLREMGVGDLSVARHIKKMAKAFYGRAAMYEEGLDGEPDALIQALEVNLFRNNENAADVINQMADYLTRAAAHLDSQDISEIIAGRVDFSVPVVRV